METIAILTAILAQTGALFYWGGSIKTLVTSLKEAKDDHEARIRELERVV